MELVDLLEERLRFLRWPGLPSECIVGSDGLSAVCFTTAAALDSFTKLAVDESIGGGTVIETLSCS